MNTRTLPHTHTHAHNHPTPRTFLSVLFDTETLLRVALGAAMPFCNRFLSALRIACTNCPCQPCILLLI